MRPILSFVLPMLNEEPNLDRLFGELLPFADSLATPFEIVCVDDGSTDGTIERLRSLNARDPRVKAVSLSRNFGKEAAMAAGFRHAAGQAVIPLDADLQHPLEMVETFIEKWREGWHVVYAYRASRADETLPKRLFSRGFYAVFQHMAQPRIPPDMADFRLMDRRVVDVLNAMPERVRFTKGLWAWAGFRQLGIPFQPRARHAGGSRFRIGTLWTFALDGLTAFSTLPLRVWSYVGAVVAGMAFLVGFYQLLRTLLFGVDVPGYASIIVSVLFLGGLQLIATGILGEYLGRIFTEVKARPIYVVGERIGFDAEETWPRLVDSPPPHPTARQQAG